MKERADFHVHLGDRTNENLLEEARRNNVAVLGVLDRGIVKTNRLRELILQGKEQNITITPGVECLTEVNINNQPVSLELLGLDFNLENTQIYHNFDPNGEFYQEKHQRKIDYQIGFLENQGFRLNQLEVNRKQWEAVKSGQFLDTAIRLCRIAANDPYNLDIFQNHQPDVEAHFQIRPQDRPGILGDPAQEALSRAKYLYWKVFAPGMPGFRKWHLDFATIINTVHDAGGVVIIPHPSFQHKQGEVGLREVIDQLFDLGVDGVECWDADILDRPLAMHVRTKGKLVLGGSGQDTTYYSNRVMGKGEIESQRMCISPQRFRDIQNYKSRNN